MSPHARRLTGELPVRAVVLVQSALAVALLALICFMLPVQQQHHNHRLPPRWEPGLGSSLPFRTWLQDLRLWTTTTDLELEPHRQAAAIISQLGGASCDLARTLSPQEIFNGGIVNGQQLDPAHSCSTGPPALQHRTSCTFSGEEMKPSNCSSLDSKPFVPEPVQKVVAQTSVRKVLA